MKTEIELKYSLTPMSYQLLITRPELRAAPVQQHLLSMYYDSPEQWLRQHGYALRIRKIGEHYIQTLKGGGKVTGAKHEREEWQTELKSSTVDPSVIPLPEIRDKLIALQQANSLLKLFTTDFLRQTWQIRYEDCLIELAIDQGHIQAKQKVEEIFELELELLEGNVAALEKFAANLAEQLQCAIQPMSKAERAYLLL